VRVRSLFLSFFSKRRENETEKKNWKKLFLSCTLSSLSFSLLLANKTKDKKRKRKEHISLPLLSLSVRPDPQVEPPLQPVRQSAFEPQGPHGRIDPDTNTDPGPGTGLATGAGRVPWHRGARVEVRAHVGEQAPFERAPADG